MVKCKISFLLLINFKTSAENEVEMVMASVEKETHAAVDATSIKDTLRLLTAMCQNNQRGLQVSNYQN